MIRAMIFDYDGVIDDTCRPVFETHCALFQHFNKGAFATFEEFRLMNSTRWRELYRAAGFTEEEISQIPDLFSTEMMARHPQVILFPHIAELVHRTARYFNLGIVSNGDGRRIHRQLAQAELEQCFQAVIDGATSPRYKPDPFQLHECMKQLEARPQETWFIGDTTDDIEAGRNAGVAKVIAVSYGYQPAEMLQDADVVVHNVSELRRVIEEALA